jgi:DNA-binding transcriptional LysR family regulator
MTLYQFTIFSAIAKRGNLTKAALDLRMSQPALTHQMKLLQESYGASLYVRTPFGIALTPAGERLLVGIGPIMDLVGKLRSRAAPAVMRKAGQEVLRVGGIESASVLLLPTVLAQFRAGHAHVALEFRTRTSDILERMVLSDSMDLAVTARHVVSSDLQCQPLRKERVALFVPARHRLANRKNLQISDVVAEPLILRGGRGGGGVTDRALQQLRDRASGISVAMYCDGPTEIKAAVAQGMGVGMVFEEALKTEVAAGKFKILKIRGLMLEGESYVVYSKSRPLGPWAQEFLEMLGRAARQGRIAGELIRDNRLQLLPKSFASNSFQVNPTSFG